MKKAFLAGIGAIISAITEKAFDWLDAPPKRVAGIDIVPYAANLEAMALPQVDTIIDAVFEVTIRKKRG